MSERLRRIPQTFLDSQGEKWIITGRLTPKPNETEPRRMLYSDKPTGDYGAHTARTITEGELRKILPPVHKRK